MLRFDERVVVITGAGNGLGYAYAREFSRRGAAVVVNDIGRSQSAGSSQKWRAEVVADELNDSGGTAVASTESVVHGKRIIATALDHFGRVDVLINNAGVLRDTSFHKMSDDDWRQMQSVHLDGSYAVTHAAWPHMRAANFGRVLFTTSAAGIYGNFGQANYAAAKAGLIGLGRSLAIEGMRRGINVNMLAPIAASQLTATVMPEKMLEKLDADLVTPIVVCLAHDGCGETGGLFEIGGGWVTRLRLERSEPVSVPAAANFNAEFLNENWSQLDSFSGQQYPSQVSDTFESVGKHLGIDLGITPQTNRDP